MRIALGQFRFPYKSERGYDPFEKQYRAELTKNLENLQTASAWFEKCAESVIPLTPKIKRKRNKKTNCIPVSDAIVEHPVNCRTTVNKQQKSRSRHEKKHSRAIKQEQTIKEICPNLDEVIDKFKELPHDIDTIAVDPVVLDYKLIDNMASSPDLKKEDVIENQILIVKDEVGPFDTIERKTDEIVKKANNVMSELSSTAEMSMMNVNVRVNDLIADAQKRIQETDERMKDIMNRFDIKSLLGPIGESITAVTNGLEVQLARALKDFGLLIVHIINAFRTEENLSLWASIFSITDVVGRYLTIPAAAAFITAYRRIIAHFMPERRDELDAMDIDIVGEGTNELDDDVRIRIGDPNREIEMDFFANPIEDEADEGVAQSMKTVFSGITKMITSKFVAPSSPFTTGSQFIVHFDNYLVRGGHIIEFFRDLFIKIHDYIACRFFGKTIADKFARHAVEWKDWAIRAEYCRKIFTNADTEEALETIATIPRRELLKMLNSVYQQGRNIEKEMMGIKDLKIHAYFRLIMKDITDMHTSFVGSTLGKNMRHEPLSIIFCGAPGVGKSYGMQQVYKDLRGCYGDTIVNPISHMYIHNGADDYCDGYIGQDVWVFDDMYQFRIDEKLTNENGLLNQLKGRNPYKLNCAALSLKTNNYATCSYIFATCNQKPTEGTVGGHSLLLDPQSALRRFDVVVEFVPKPEYRGIYTNNLYMLNAAGAALEGYAREDIMTYTLTMRNGKVFVDLTYNQLIAKLFIIQQEFDAYQRMLDLKDKELSRFLPTPVQNDEKSCMTEQVPYQHCVSQTDAYEIDKTIAPPIIVNLNSTIPDPQAYGILAYVKDRKVMTPREWAQVIYTGLDTTKEYLKCPERMSFSEPSVFWRYVNTQFYSIKNWRVQRQVVRPENMMELLKEIPDDEPEQPGMWINWLEDLCRKALRDTIDYQNFAFETTNKLLLKGRSTFKDDLNFIKDVDFLDTICNDFYEEANIHFRDFADLDLEDQIAYLPHDDLPDWFWTMIREILPDENEEEEEVEQVDDEIGFKDVYDILSSKNVYGQLNERENMVRTIYHKLFNYAVNPKVSIAARSGIMNQLKTEDLENYTKQFQYCCENGIHIDAMLPPSVSGLYNDSHNQHTIIDAQCGQCVWETYRGVTEREIARRQEANSDGDEETHGPNCLCSICIKEAVHLMLRDEIMKNEPDRYKMFQQTREDYHSHNAIFSIVQDQYFRRVCAMAEISYSELANKMQMGVFYALVAEGKLKVDGVSRPYAFFKAMQLGAGIQCKTAWVALDGEKSRMQEFKEYISNQVSIVVHGYDEKKQELVTLRTRVLPVLKLVGLMLVPIVSVVVAKIGYDCATRAKINDESRNKKEVVKKVRKARVHGEDGYRCTKCHRTYVHYHDYSRQNTIVTASGQDEIIDAEASLPELAEIYEDIDKNIVMMSTESYVDPSAIQVQDMVKCNMVRIVDTSTNRSVNGFFIGGSIVITVKHIISQNLHTPLSIEGGMHNISVTKEPIILSNLDPREYYISDKKDLMAINLARYKIAPYKSLVKHIVQSEELQPWKSHSILMAIPRWKTNDDNLSFLDPTGSFYDRESNNCTYVGGTYQSSSTGQYVTKYLRYTMQTTSGDCGSIIIAMNTSMPRKIIGYHTGSAKNGEGVGNFLTQIDVQRIEKHFGEEVIEQSGPVVITNPFEESNFSILKKEDAQNVEIVGTIPKNFSIRTPSHTTLEKSRLYNKVYETTMGPAVLRTMNGKDPLRLGIEAVFCPDYPFRTTFLNLAIDGVTNTICGMRSAYRDGFIMSDEETLNGIPGCEAIQSIDHNTSAGYPFVLIPGAKGKDKILEIDLDGHMSLLPETSKIINEYEKRLHEGKKIISFCIDTKKDEKRPLEKIESCSTRIFQNCDFVTNFLIRKYCQAFVAHCYDNCVYGPIAVGINVHSEQWGMLKDRLVANSPNIIAGDYSKYDKKLPYRLMVEGMRVINDFYEDEYASLRNQLMSSIVGAYHVLGTSMYKSHHGMPSGVVLTATYNSLINAILFRYVYIVLAHKEHGEEAEDWINRYDELIAESYYGDDHLVSVSTLVPWFNMQTVAEELSKIGLSYTTMDKKKVVKPYFSIDEVTYLKRRFVERDCRTMAPLDFTSLKELWNWTRKSEDPAQNLDESVKAYFQELSHYQREFWEAEYDHCLSRSRECGYKMPLSTYASNYKTLFGELPAGDVLLVRDQSTESRDNFDQQAVTVENGITGITDVTDKVTELIHGQTYKLPTLTNPYPEPSIKDFVSRPYIIGDYTWNTGSTGVIAELSFPDALFRVQPIWDKLKNFEFFRFSSIKVEMRINGTQYHYGDVMVTSIPQYANGYEKSFYDNIYALSPTSTLVPATNNVVKTFILPYVNAKQYINLSRLNDVTATATLEFLETEVSRFRVFVVNPVLPSPVTIILTANFVDPEIAANGLGREDYHAAPFTPVGASAHQPTGFSYTGPLLVKDEMGELSPGTGEASNKIMKCNEKAGGFIDKILGGFARGITKGFGKLGEMGGTAAIMALNKPNDVQTKTRAIAAGYSLSQTRGLEYSEVLALDPANRVGDFSQGMMSNDTEMTFQNIITKYGLIHVITVPATTEVGAVIAQYYVHPLFIPIANVGTDDILFHTPLSFVASCFSYFRGSMKYKFHICCSAFHTFRLRFVWYPGEIPVLTPKERLLYETNAVSHILDVNGSTDFEFSVPYLHDEIYLPLFPVYVQGSNSRYLRTVGSISITLINNINFNSTPIPPIYINTFVSAGDDMVFAKPTSVRLGGLIPTFEDESGLIETTAPISPTHMCFGEEIFNVKELCARKCVSHIVPDVDLAISYNLQWFPEIDHTSFFKHFHLMYRFWRGSNVITWFNSTDALFYATVIYQAVPSQATPGTLSRYRPTTVDLNKASGEGQFILPSIDSRFNFPSVVIPYYTHRMFLPVRHTQRNEATPYDTYTAVLHWYGQTNSSISETPGDDFQFGCMLGAPTVQQKKDHFLWSQIAS